MESSKEHIEAQLCAYVDGELNEAERVEIERHLDVNPQHKALISELRRASGLLQDLPRAKAPIELNEAVCGQLERSALLNPSDDEANHAIITINRWPQITAVAAVLFLALGLGIVVYYVLPPSTGNARGPLAMEDASGKHGRARGEGGKDQRDAELSEKQERADRHEALGAPAPDLSKRKAALDKPQLQPAKPDNFEIHDAIQNGTDNKQLDLRATVINSKNGLITGPEVDAIRQRMRRSDTNDAIASDNGVSLYLVVSTSNTASASGQVVDYFKSNRIQYLSYDAAATSTREPTSLAAGTAPVDSNKGELGAVDHDRAFGEAEKPRGGGFGGGAGGMGGGRGGGGGAGSDGAAPAVPNAESKKMDARVEEQRDGYAYKVKAGEAAAREEKAPSEPAAIDPGVHRGYSVDAAKPDAQGAQGKPPAAKTEPYGAELSLAATKPADKTDPTNQERSRGVTQAAAQPDFGRKVESPVTVLPTTSPDRDWSMKVGRTAAGDRFSEESNPVPSNGIIRAMMTRRQASELRVTLSRQQGQHAELLTSDAAALNQTTLGDDADRKASEREATSHFEIAVGRSGGSNATGITLDKSATSQPTFAKYESETTRAPTAVATARGLRDQPTTRLADPNDPKMYEHLYKNKKSDVDSDGTVNRFGLKPDPMDEPVDVVIVVKIDPTAAPALQLGAPAGATNSQTPNSVSDPKPPADTKK
jgi:hypothetical protein